MQNIEIPLHDIKPLLEIREYSLYYFLGLSTLALAIIALLAYFIYRLFKNRNKFNLRVEHLKLLNAVDYTDVKKAAYDVTFYGATFQHDSDRHTRAFEDLQERLEAYKYKKTVEESFDDETLLSFDTYKGMLDV